MLNFVQMFPDDQSKMWSSLCGESDFNMDPSVGLDSLFSELFSSMYPTNTKPMDCNVIEEQSFNSEPSALPVLHSTYIKESFLSTMSTMSESPISSDSGIHQHRLSTVPRYKRPSHKRAELKRRDKIKVWMYWHTDNVLNSIMYEKKLKVVRLTSNVWQSYDIHEI